jgi:hypothetical protein
MDNDVLAAYLARKIFECPHGAGNRDVQRIAFKAGPWENETDLGGLCEGALESVIRNALRSLPTSGEMNAKP